MVCSVTVKTSAPAGLLVTPIPGLFCQGLAWITADRSAPRLVHIWRRVNQDSPVKQKWHIPPLHSCRPGNFQRILSSLIDAGYWLAAWPRPACGSIKVVCHRHRWVIFSESKKINDWASTASTGTHLFHDCSRRHRHINSLSIILWKNLRRNGQRETFLNDFLIYLLRSVFLRYLFFLVFRLWVIIGSSLFRTPLREGVIAAIMQSNVIQHIQWLIRTGMVM